MTAVIFDLESDDLLDAATKIHCLQIGDADGSDVVLYGHDMELCDRPMAEGVARLKAASRVVGHNLIAFDFPMMERFFPGTLTLDRLYDTLVIARLTDPEERNNTLRAWGERLEVSKGDFSGDFSVFTPEMATYARQDIVTTRALYRHLAPKVEGWGESVELEHRVAYAIHLQERNGFRLDVPAAQRLEMDLRGEVSDIERDLQSVFPPIWVAEGKKGEVFVPKRPNKTAGYVAGAPLTKVSLQLFNPSSRQQCAERLMRLGWKPREFGASGAPVVDEATLSALPWKEAKALVKYFNALKLLGQVADGKSGWLKLVKPTGRVHGRVNPNGACTGRMSHSNPNLAQVSKDHRARSCWIARPGWKLVGCDAEGLEARVLAHYLARWDGGAFAHTLLHGDKSKGTDIHTANLRAAKSLGLQTRDGAKTLLYALMYGAGDMKLGLTIKEDCRNAKVQAPRVPNRELGALARKALAKSMVGIDKLTAACQARHKERGYVTGLDGRRIFIRHAHSALNTLLQGGGSIAMKKALEIFVFESAPAAGWIHGEDFGLCANVHDEAQLEARPEIAEAVGKAFAEAIAEAGRRLKMKCPLAGAFDVGSSWADTH